MKVKEKTVELITIITFGEGVVGMTDSSLADRMPVFL